MSFRGIHYNHIWVLGNRLVSLENYPMSLENLQNLSQWFIICHFFSTDTKPRTHSPVSSVRRWLVGLATSIVLANVGRNSGTHSMLCKTTLANKCLQSNLLSPECRCQKNVQVLSHMCLTSSVFWSSRERYDTPQLADTGKRQKSSCCKKKTNSLRHSVGEEREGSWANQHLTPRNECTDCYAPAERRYVHALHMHVYSSMI